MRKILIYFASFILICFILPALFTKKTKEVSTTEETINENANATEEIAQSYNYSKFATIKLLHTETNEVEEIPFDEYLYGVVSAEMPADYEVEALKAQAVVARTYSIYQITNSSKHENADLCDSSSCCQAWISKEDRLARWDEDLRESNWSKIVSCVDATSGKVVTYQGKVINAFFHSNSGGVTEMPVNVWGGTDYPYLQSVETAGESEYTQYSSEVSISKTDLLSKLKEKHADIEIDFSASDCISILERTDSGRVRTVKFGNIQISGVEARTTFGLKSANFDINIDGDNVEFSVTGYGHGVGLSQTGSDSMAKSGSTYDEIIKHFYTGVEITEVNDL